MKRYIRAAESTSGELLNGRIKWSLHGSVIDIYTQGNLDYTFEEGFVLRYIKTEGYPWFSYRDQISTVNVTGKCVPDRAFSNYLNIRDVNIDASYVGDYAFYGCTNLQHVHFSNSTYGIRDSAFQKCINLTKIEFPDSLDEITDYAFADCTQLVDVIKPHHRINLYRTAFNNTPYQSNKQANKKPTWRNIQQEIEVDDSDIFDPDSKSAQYVETVMHQIESRLNIWLEPSIQGNIGTIVIYRTKTNENLAECDYQSFNDAVVDLVLTSKNVSEFKKLYQDYLNDLIEESQKRM